MREILFRGKRKEADHEWVEGFYAKPERKHYIIVPISEFLVDWHEVDPVTIGQYTGLKDKNGKMIFEGDILAIKFFPGYVERVLWDGPPDAIAKVFWDLNAFSLDANGKLDKRYADFCDINYKETEIIGNIHDNPELLKGES